MKLPITSARKELPVQFTEALIDSMRLGTVLFDDTNGRGPWIGSGEFVAKEFAEEEWSSVVKDWPFVAIPDDAGIPGKPVRLLNDEAVSEAIQEYFEQTDWAWEDAAEYLGLFSSKEINMKRPVSSAFDSTKYVEAFDSTKYVEAFDDYVLQLGKDTGEKVDAYGDPVVPGDVYSSEDDGLWPIPAEDQQAAKDYMNGVISSRRTSMNRRIQSNINVDESGDWDSLRVSLTEDKLEYRSYRESKVEGYDFTMKKEGDRWVVESDDSSTPVPGSSVLWLYANGYTSWDDVPGGKEPDVVEIAAPVMESAVSNMISDEYESLDLSVSEELDSSRRTNMNRNIQSASGAELDKLSKTLQKINKGEMPSTGLIGLGLDASSPASNNESKVTPTMATRLGIKITEEDVRKVLQEIGVSSFSDLVKNWMERSGNSMKTKTGGVKSSENISQHWKDQSPQQAGAWAKAEAKYKEQNGGKAPTDPKGWATVMAIAKKIFAKGAQAEANVSTGVMESLRQKMASLDSSVEGRRYLAKVTSAFKIFSEDESGIEDSGGEEYEDEVLEQFEEGNIVLVIEPDEGAVYISKDGENFTEVAELSEGALEELPEEEYEDEGDPDDVDNSTSGITASRKINSVWKVGISDRNGDIEDKIFDTEQEAQDYVAEVRGKSSEDAFVEYAREIESSRSLRSDDQFLQPVGKSSVGEESDPTDGVSHSNDTDSDDAANTDAIEDENAPGDTGTDGTSAGMAKKKLGDEPESAVPLDLGQIGSALIKVVKVLSNQTAQVSLVPFVSVDSAVSTASTVYSAEVPVKSLEMAGVDIHSSQEVLLNDPNIRSVLLSMRRVQKSGTTLRYNMNKTILSTKKNCAYLLRSSKFSLYLIKASLIPGIKNSKFTTFVQMGSQYVSSSGHYFASDRMVKFGKPRFVVISNSIRTYFEKTGVNSSKYFATLLDDLDRSYFQSVVASKQEEIKNLKASLQLAKRKIGIVSFRLQNTSLKLVSAKHELLKKEQVNVSLLRKIRTSSVNKVEENTHDIDRTVSHLENLMNNL